MIKTAGLFLLGGWAVLLAPIAASAEFGTTVQMRSKGAETYYVSGAIRGVGEIDLLVDTGSSYSTIGQDTLDILIRRDSAVYVRKLTGIMADGSQMTVPIYRIGGVVIGTECWLSEVEAAVFPGSTRFILGLSGLRQAAPFIFSLDPPQLVLSNCGDPSTLAAQDVQLAVDEDAADVAMAESDVPALASHE